MKKSDDFKHKKKYGQNFLDDIELLNKIEVAINVNENDNIIEIGPGVGYLTKMLLEKGVNLTSFEIDKDLIPILNKKFSTFNNFKLINIDFLEANLEEILGNKEYKVVANIPYYITAPIINKLLEHKKNITEIFLMVQKEVAQRLSIQNTGSDRSIFTHAIQFFADVEYLFTVSKEKFTPIPKVDSAFLAIRLYKNNKYENLIDFNKYIKYVKASFQNKRKNIINNLKHIGLSKEILKKSLESIGKSENTRAEELDIYDFISLIKIIEEETNV